ncbi:hypothetical protein LGL55_14990 [Clostridium tagluense]|nr:hypothetical protein [Clostridium tagluense]MCB2322132.1 hypothetical protein [Clostridium tagluense]MCB2336649.1 hypothetical protein [Clostridium tagluense]MCB2365522.1 hypothetical protein [Clostridium tagluense]
MVEEEARNNVNLIITHYDAWEWVAGIKEEALQILTLHHTEFAHLL